MAQQIINLAVANNRGGDDLRAGGDKINQNTTELYNRTSVFITEESDFPVQDANTVTLQNGLAYVIPNGLVMSKRFVAETNSKCSVFGFGFNSTEISYSGTGTMFSGVDASIEILNISLEPGANNDLLDYSSTSGLTNSVVLDKVQVGDCASFGKFENLFVVLMDNCSADDTTGIELSGAFGVLSIDRTNFVGPATMKGIDFGTSTFALSVNLTRSAFFGPAGAFGISGAAASANIGAGIQANISLTNFTGGLTPLETISTSDVRWEFRANTPIADSRNDADVFLIGGSETITTGSAGDWQEIGVPSGGGVTWDSDIAERFTVGTNGVLTYIGEKPIEIQATARATIEKVGGGANVLEARLALNWTGVVSDGGLAKSRAQTQSSDPTTVPLGALIPMVQNDNVRVIFSNTDGTSDIIAAVAALEVTGR